MRNNTVRRHSKILPVVIIGLTLILLAMGLFWIISTQQMEDLSVVIKKSKIITKKMDIVASMTDIARTRSRLTMQMVYTDDVFYRDEISMELNSKATEFAVLRQKLLSTGLNDKEKSLLEAQSKYIKSSLTRQRVAAELALSINELDRKIAGDIVINEVYPDQGMVVDYFMKLLESQKLEFDSIAEQSLNNLQKNTRFNEFMIFMVVLGTVAIIIFMVKNIRRIENQLILEKEKALVTLRSIGDGVITVNNQGEIEYLNEVAIKIIGEPSEKLVGSQVNDLFNKEFSDRKQLIWQCIQQVLDVDQSIKETSNIQFGLNNNPSLILRANISSIVDVHDQINGVVISFHDITESQNLMNKIQHQASHDALTGLYNRRAFEEKVMQMIRLYNHANHSFCIIDLDQFKIVNDSAGHAAGDEMLKQIAEVMKPALRKSDLLSRLGGDEFGLFISNVTPQEAIDVAEKLLNAIQTLGFYWEDNVYRVGASIGMVNVSAEFTDYEYLYQAADSACYVAKNEGRNRIHLMPVDAEILTKKARDSEYLQYLNKTLDSGQFILYGQNIEPISLRTTGRKHVEVLLRMKDEAGEIILPMAFIPIAERYGLMANIDYWVLHQVCELILAQPLDDTVYAVNLSGLTLSSTEHMDKILSLIHNCNLPPGRLCLEVTETVAIANLDIASKFMTGLQQYGCTIALDDFGSGLSSFSYLNSLPLDFLKIDGIFVKSMEQDKSSIILIEAIHTVGKKLGLITIAEYAETKSTVDKLRKIGIDMAQGYYFDKPHELIIPQNIPHDIGNT